MVAFKHIVKLNYLGGEVTIFYFLFLGKHSQEFPKKLGRLVIDYFMLVTYGVVISLQYGKFLMK